MESTKNAIGLSFFPASASCRLWFTLLVTSTSQVETIICWLVCRGLPYFTLLKSKLSQQNVYLRKLNAFSIIMLQFIFKNTSEYIEYVSIIRFFLQSTQIVMNSLYCLIITSQRDKVVSFG